MKKKFDEIYIKAKPEVILEILKLVKEKKNNEIHIIDLEPNYKGWD